MATASINLGLNLNPWKRGMDQAGKITQQKLGGRIFNSFRNGAKRAAAGMRRAFTAAAGVIRSALGSAFAPLLALAGVAAIINGIKNAVTGSLAAFREYSDSVTTLTSALESTGVGNVEGRVKQVEELGNKLRLAMGIEGAKTNAAFSTFLTRGFSDAQSQQLTILAANFAKKTGKDLETVTRKIADAANGSVDAMKVLGVEIATTGNKVKDGEAAVAALKSAYGDIGTELANPSERLAASINKIAVSFGEKLSPVLEPVIQGVSDFVTGLTESKEGQAILEGIAGAIGKIIEVIGTVTRRISAFVAMLTHGLGVVDALILKTVNGILAKVFKKIMETPILGDLLSDTLGIDGNKLAEDFGKAADKAGNRMDGALSKFQESQRAWANDEEAGFFGTIKDLQRKGQEAREAARGELEAEMAATKDQRFAGGVAYAEEAEKARKEAEKAAKKRQGAIEKQARSFAGAAEYSDGMQVNLTLRQMDASRFEKRGGRRR